MLMPSVASKHTIGAQEGKSFKSLVNIQLLFQVAVCSLLGTKRHA